MEVRSVAVSLAGEVSKAANLGYLFREKRVALWLRRSQMVTANRTGAHDTKNLVAVFRRMLQGGIFSCFCETMVCVRVQNDGALFALYFVRPEVI